ncbi:MAG: DUF5688 family protein [Eubacterium sp.]|nr:DUF5688 family protein [Eubacterium sp.]
MNREEFQDALIDELRNNLPDSYSIDIVHTTKNNDINKTGIVIKASDSAFAPTVYVEDLYNDYKVGRTMSDITDHVIRIAGERPTELDPARLISRENILENAVFKMRNIERNESYLDNVPVKEIEGMDDIVLVPYLDIDMGLGGSRGSIMLKNDILDSAGIEKDELFNAATENSEGSNIVIKRISDIIGMSFEESNDNNMFVAMDKGYNGISPLACRDFFEQVEEEMGTDKFIIVPSSIYELIIVKDIPGCDNSMLFDIVSSVNSTMKDEEILGYNIYEYNQGEVKTLNAENERERYAEM